MSDETNLNTYKLQLQQVEAALENDPENEDLLKLKKDLEDVIELTLELVTSDVGTSSGTQEDAAAEEEEAVPVKDWKAGDLCMAKYSKDGGFYDAKVDEVLEDGSCTVTFDGWSNTEVTKVSLLKEVDPNAKRDGTNGPDSKKSKKDLIQQQKEYKKKKSQKKKLRLKQLEEEREGEKIKWKSFNSKIGKLSKGYVKKSIFATPDPDTEGKVGVGTCGVAGRPMTKFNTHEKWKK